MTINIITFPVVTKQQRNHDFEVGNQREINKKKGFKADIFLLRVYLLDL